MSQQTVALYTVTSGDRLEQARASLAEALGGASLGEVDDAGVFELNLDAESPDQARALVQEAFARAGTGDDFVIRETTEGREVAPDDPRQAGADQAAAERAASRGAENGGSDPAGSVADAAQSVAAAATGAASRVQSAAEDSGAADKARDLAGQARQAAEDSGAADKARELGGQAASTASAAAEGRPWVKTLAPFAGLAILLIVLRRGTRR
jgi:hypothetical protein